MNKGFLISIEGGEGSGKGTVVSKLKELYPDFIFTREPGGTAISEQIRNVIVDKNNTEMCPETEALLFAAARAQLMREKVFPAIQAGKTVFFDRFVDSSLVYQGIARGLDVPRVAAINEIAINGMYPNLTIYLDIDPAVGLSRIHANEGREVNRLDLEALDFHNKIREGYLTMAHIYEGRYRIVNADQSPENVLSEVVSHINELLNSNS